TREQLPQQWTAIRKGLVAPLQELFAAHKFRVTLELLRVLEGEKDLADDPQLLALVYLLKVLNHEALAERIRVTEDLDDLTIHIGRQPKEFRIEWDLSRLRVIIEHCDVEAIAAHRGLFLGVLDAASKSSRDDIVTALKRLKKK